MPHASPGTHTTVQNLVAVYVDCCNKQGRTEMVVMKGHIARRVKEILDAGCEHARLERAVETFVDRRCRTALQLAEIYAELAQNELLPVAEQPLARRRAQTWISENGWPTGARFVRGLNAGNYVYDPLGLERIPYHDWPHPKPSFEDIVEAVAELPLERGRDAERHPLPAR